MSKAKRNKLLRTQSEHKGEARQLRHRVWMFRFPRSKPKNDLYRIVEMRFSLNKEEWERMQRAQIDHRR